MTIAFAKQTKNHEESVNEQMAGKEAMSKPLAIIEKWEVVQSTSQRFKAFEVGTCLRGYVFGRANLSSTKLVYTSPIVGANLTLGLVETRNTIYRLGEPSEEYKSWSAGGHGA
jgi:hypothetical protein